MVGEKIEDENGTIGRETGHGPSLCSCIDAEKCPYWEKKLKSSDLSMSRGMSIGPGKHQNIIYVGNSEDLDKIKQ